MSQRWAIWLSVEGDLRFCSHHDMMRAVERSALRAELPLRYTQGFNPHPIHSLVLPRSVGVTSLDDLWVFTLDEERSPEQVVAALNAASLPMGLTVLGACVLPPKATPQPVVADYALSVAPEWQTDLATRVEELQSQGQWNVDRKKKPKGRRRSAPQFKTVDLKASVENLAIDGDTLYLSVRSTVIPSARPNELIAMLGLPTEAISHLTRTGVVYTLSPDTETDFRKETPT